MHRIRRLAVILAAPATVAALSLAGPALAASASPAGHAQPASSAVGDPGVYLESTPSLTLAAPNKVVSGSAAVLKTCLGNGNCAIFANDKGTETFDFIPSTTLVSGTMVRLHGTDWCLTSRAAPVTFEACHSYASQLWDGSGGVLDGVLTNVKTGLHLTHTFLAPYAPVQAGGSFTFWGNSS